MKEYSATEATYIIKRAYPDVKISRMGVRLLRDDGFIPSAKKLSESDVLIVALIAVFRSTVHSAILLKGVLQEVKEELAKKITPSTCLITDGKRVSTFGENRQLPKWESKTYHVFAVGKIKAQLQEYGL